MTMRTRVTLAGGVLILSAWALVQAQGAPVVATMTLNPSGSTCGKTLVGNGGGSVIRAKRGAAVQWKVVNNCSANQTVAVGDFVRKSDGVAESPFGPGGNPSCVARPGAANGCTIALTVRPNASTITYSYATSLNGVKVDPDIIIEP